MKVKIVLNITCFGEGETQEKAVQEALNDANWEFFTTFEKEDIVKINECDWEYKRNEFGSWKEEKE